MAAHPPYWMEMPMPLVTFPVNAAGSEQTEFVVNGEALDVLALVPRAKTVTVLTIAGVARTGKSYILSRVFGEQNGFGLGHQTRSFTRGVWMWIRDHPTDPSRVLVVLDTEGIDSVPHSPDEIPDPTKDHKIFTLALLLGNVTVYNCMKTIDAEQINKLAFVAKLSEVVKSKTGHTVAALAPSTGRLVWVVRDFTLSLAGRTADMYMNTALEETGGLSMAAAKSDEIRSVINTLFPPSHRECFTMATPDLDRMDELDTFPFEDLRPEFVADMNAVVGRLHELTALTSASIDGIPLDAVAFGLLTQQFVNAFNTGAVPSVDGLFAQVQRIAAAKAIAAGVDAYTATMDAYEAGAGDVAVATADLLAAHVDAQADAYNAFVEHAVGTGPIVTEANDELMAALGDLVGLESDQLESEELFETQFAGLLADYVRRNWRRSRDAASALIRTLHAPIAAGVLDGTYSPGQAEYDAYQAALEDAREQYFAAATGPAALLVYRAYRADTITTERNSLLAMNSALSEAERAAASAAADAQAQADAAAEAEAARAALAADMEIQRTRYLADLEEQRQTMVAEQDRRIRDEQQRLEAAAEARLRAIRESNEREAARQAAAMRVLREEAAERERAAAAERARLQAELEAQRKRAQELAARPPQVVYRGCFAGGATAIRLGDGPVPLAALRVGDRVAAVDAHGALIFSPIFYTAPASGTFEVVVLSTSAGTDLALTGQHLVYLAPADLADGDAVAPSRLAALAAPVMAQDVKPGATVVVRAPDGGAVAATVTARSLAFRHNLYCVLTLANCLFVDGVLASAYETNHKWEIWDTLDMRLLYLASPAAADSRVTRSLVAAYDAVVNPLAYRIARGFAAFRSALVAYM